ncbi:hypothetical protein [Streptomyces goshikiensis]|uniref:hypothetical protein n=1 Tax=Streptomyces goshikiensis TaxID=1942 RepID=UPI00367EDEBC
MTAAPKVSAANPLLTMLVLPGGGVHASGRLLSAPDPSGALDQAWALARTAVKSLGRAVQVNVGRPDGTVETSMMDRDGSRVRLSAPPVVPPLDPADARWTDHHLSAHPLVTPIREAASARGLPPARAAAQHLAQQLHHELEPTHPYLILADELRAHLALRDQDWLTAARLYRAVADAHHQLRAPAAVRQTPVHNAVATWLLAADTAGSQVLNDGAQLGHLLVRIAPRHRTAIATVLDRLHTLTAPVSRSA